ncbi:hypothetical protein GALMADRAFT_252295 [Galerina marginata CBS 339.88]|uniref:Golgi apparatus membrane protein TVP38 n=1 Tax=Galerina marginata (strain CBS 339.88) TaxID=685588 RepID=A0A067T1T4_GALM3|nr:hypothetical protein GALMADRAFT_252295 [Galerina marginata CBS 339.88]
MASQQQHFGRPQGGPMLGVGYPPQNDGMYATLNSTTTIETKVGDVEDARRISRTPSPTPSEAKELRTGAIDWKTLSSPKFWIRREWLWYYVILVVILTITALVTIYHKQIVTWLTPVTLWLHDLKFGWLVPIGILFVLSFPPLFGHEIVAILCGLVWGLWIGFGIVAAGTFVGEVGNFYAFKYCCRSRGEKLERTKISYSCLARVVREGGFKIALIARLSAIPGHFTTAVFSTCGMGIIVFSIAAILSLPKQFITVYLGVILKESNSGVEDKKSRIISDVVLAITFIITILAMWWILRQMNMVKPKVIYERRKARQTKMMRAANSPYMTAGPSRSDVFNPNGSDSDIPLTTALPDANPQYQQWDKHGNAVGYVPDPILHTPKPRMHDATFLPPSSRYPRDEEEGGARPFMGHGREDSADVVGWETGNDAATREFLPKNEPSRPLHLGGAAPSGLQNPHSPNQPKVFIPEMGQTPTQANFVNDWPGPSAAHATSSHGHQSSYEDPYGGYDIAHRHGHAQEATDDTFRTAFSSSPDDLGDSHVQHIPNPHAVQSSPYGAFPGQTQPNPSNQSPTPQNYNPNLR